MKKNETIFLNRDQFAKFIFKQDEKIKNYNFDLLHDIAKIINYAYNSENYRDEYGQIIADKPVKKIYNFYIKTFGSWLFDKDDETNVKIIEDNEYLNKYEITIIPNCDYLYNIEFAEIKKIK